MRLRRADPLPGDSALRQGGGDFVSAALFVLAWLFAGLLSDGWMQALVLAVAMQLLLLPHFVAAIVPRDARSLLLLLLMHLLLFLALMGVLRAHGASDMAPLSVLTAQAPLLLRSLVQLTRPRATDGHWLAEGMGAFVLVPFAVGIAVLAVRWLPDLGLAGRELPLPGFAALNPEALKFALMFGGAFFALMGLGRMAAWQVRVHRREDIDAATLRAWEEAYRQSRGGSRKR